MKKRLRAHIRQNVKDALRAVDAFRQGYTSYDMHEAIVDLVTDLMHLADARKLDWPKIVAESTMHHEAEVDGND